MSMKHVVIGTAGHIDHGKSALVLALTGTDPDRLQEEKARGITIDLGFAHTTEEGVALSFVDVPGHERFVRNMLAGVGGMDLVMLHVAADESVMPQTREHFDICRLLHVPAGLVVMTKSDLSDPAMLDVVRLEIEELVAGSFLEGAPVLAVSARTGAGLPELRRTLASLAAAAAARPCEGPPRLPIDRVFSMKGFGTVVTGTLISGRLCVDDELVLQPSGRAVKVRGLHVHGAPQPQAIAGQRVAVNVAGVDVVDLERGETLTGADCVSVSRHADVRLELLASARPLRHGARVRFHQGTRELLGRIALPDSAEVRPGATASARVHLEAPAVIVRGDRFILRAYSPLATIGGGTVLDPLPPRRGVRTAAGIARFRRLSSREPGFEAVLAMIDETGLTGFREQQLVGRAGIMWSERDRIVVQLEPHVLRIAGTLIARSRVAAAEEALLTTIGRYHADHPLDEGIPREELRERVFGDAPPVVFDTVLRALAEKGRIAARDRVALAGHSLALSDEEIRVRDAVVDTLREAGLTPPDPAAIAARIGAERDVIDRIVTLLVRQKVLVRAGELIFHEAALAQLKAQIRSLKEIGAAAALDVGAFKERYNVSRKFAIPLMEFLDRERITRRIGDKRHIL
jgi:selenocysteine-specific elongation factor